MKILLSCLLAASASLCVAQSTPPSVPPPAAAPADASAPHAIEKGSTVFLEPMDGFDTYLAAAILNKKVPLRVVDDRSKADYVITGGSKVEAAGWAKTLFISPLPHATASIAMKDKDGSLVFAYAVDKSNARKASQSTAEACAKHLKEFIDKSDKK